LIDISTEKLITLAQAAEKLQVSKASITRWIIHGTHGIRLEALKFGAYWRTSEEALQRFGENQTPTNIASFSPSTNYKSFAQESPKRLREIERACEELDERLGIRKCETCRKKLDAGYVALPKNEKLWCPKCLVLRMSVTMGQRVRTFRWDAKLSQQALSKRCGISVDFIRAIEENRKQPTVAQLAKMVEFFGQSFVTGLELETDTSGNLSCETHHS
jgi:DNA-binding XRE family transcriptional regulator